MAPERMVGLAKSMVAADSRTIYSHTLKGEDRRENGAWYYFADEEDVEKAKGWIEAWLNEATPKPLLPLPDRYAAGSAVSEGESTMNIAFFLLPKQEVVTVTADATLRQTLERMEYHRYTAVPILNAQGGYAGTVTEGDLLWYMKSHPEITFEHSHRVKLSDVPLRLDNRTVPIDARMEDLISLAKVQNFVPVVDDMNRFIGIVRRSDIIDYCAGAMVEHVKSGKETAAAGSNEG